MIALTKPSVVFNKESHTYFLDGKQLSGITSLLERKLFPTKYAGVDEDTLHKAAEYGSNVHEQIAEDDGIDEFVLDEVLSYRKIITANNLKPIAHEYLVTDSDKYASAIDLVLENEDGTVDLADIKTTYKLDKDYVSWQLSIYAYLFELCNPGVKVNNLYGLWLRDDKSSYEKVYRHDKDEVLRLLADDTEDTFLPDSPTMPADIVEMASQLEEYFAILKRYEKKYKEQEKEFKTRLTKLMGEAGIYNISIGGLKISYVKGYTKSSIDSTRLKKEMPEIIDKYSKITNVSPTIKITQDE